jgi:predicted transcriptional regulator
VAAYRRFVAFVYIVTPEQFTGMAEADIARALGITPRAWRRHAAEAARTIGG